MTGVQTCALPIFPGADIGSDHDLVMMTFKVRLKKISKPKFTRLRFNLEKLKDPAVREEFQAMIGGKFAPLTILDENNLNLEATVEAFNAAVVETASEILGKHQRPKKPWVTTDILMLCDKRRELKKEKKDPEGAKNYRETNNKVKREMRKAKESWIEQQCSEIEESLERNNTKKAYQVIKDLTTEKHSRPTSIQDKAGKCLTEDKEMLDRWTEYCSELYNHQLNGDPTVLNCPTVTTEEIGRASCRERV